MFGLPGSKSKIEIPLGSMKVMNQIKCVIIDDDRFVRRLLSDRLMMLDDEVEILAEAKDGLEGIQVILEHNPDLVFVDVEMPDMTGFELLSRLDQIDFQVIFITSYKHYAIKAIRFNALDYLVKPIDVDELKDALNRYRNRIDHASHHQAIQAAVENVLTADPGEQRLTFYVGQGVERPKLKDICYISAEGNYSTLSLTSGNRIIVSRNLGDFEEILEDKGFFRCHRSYLINKRHISGHSASEIQMVSVDKIPIARRKKTAFLRWLEEG